MAFFDLEDGYYFRTYEEDKPEALSIDDSTLVFILELLVAKGYDKIVFYDRDDRWSIPEFIQWAKSPDKIFCIVYRKDGVPASITWFNGFSETGHQAYSHFSTLGTVSNDECMHSGRMILKRLTEVTRLKQFIGITPIAYSHALRFSEGLGFRPLVVLEKYCKLRGKERNVRLSICEPGKNA